MTPPGPTEVFKVIASTSQAPAFNKADVVEADIFLSFRNPGPAAVASLAATLNAQHPGQWAQVTKIVRMRAPAPPPPAGTVFRDCPACPEMVALPGGTFAMGSPPTEPALGRSLESPQHQVTIAPLAVGKFHVTRADWDICVVEGGCPGPRKTIAGQGNFTAEVTWDAAHAYTAWLSRKTGSTYRLPSEAEWEYAARGGRTTRYYWGDNESHDYANYGMDTACLANAANGTNFACIGATGGRDRFAEEPPVGSFDPNPFGLYDMLGNAMQMIEDCWNFNYTGAPTDGRPWTSGDCSNHPVRGGNWFSGPQDIRAASRKYQNGGGFRIVKTY